MLYEIIVLLVLLYATYTDFKTREVPDWLSHGLIIVALLLRVFDSFIVKSLQPIIEGTLGFGLFFLIGYLLYKTNQWGGGDAKILGGIGAMFGFYSNNLYMLDFITNLLVVGGIYGLLYSFYLAYKFKGKITMQKYVSPLKLTEGDWVVNDIKIGRKTIAQAKDNGLALDQIDKIKAYYRKGKIKKVLIKEGIPFIPSFLLAFGFTWTYGSVFVLLLNFLSKAQELRTFI